MTATGSVSETEQLVAQCEALRRRVAELEAERHAHLAQRQPEQQKLDAQRTELHMRDAALAATLTGVAISDLEGTLVYVNPAFARIHGCSVSEVVGKKATSLWPAQASEVLEREIQKKPSQW